MNMHSVLADRIQGILLAEMPCDIPESRVSVALAKIMLAIKKAEPYLKETASSQLTLHYEDSEPSNQKQLDFAHPPIAIGGRGVVKKTPTLPVKCYAFPCQFPLCRDIELPCGKGGQNA